MHSESARTRVAIVGGGPGGLVSAYLLEHRFFAPVDITIFEASDRLGGKIVTRQFEHHSSTSPIRYEAGAAELYDYSSVGPDPLRELIAELGLTTHPIAGRAVFLGDQLLATERDIHRVGGPAAQAAYDAFARHARTLISPESYYESDWKQDNSDPLTRQSFQKLLESVNNDVARKYIEVAIHSDLATEPQRTSAVYGLQNFLMNEPGYMSLYAIDGGMERLPQALAKQIGASIRLNSSVYRIESLAAASETPQYRLHWRQGNRTAFDDFDAVIVALPHGHLSSIEWSDASLATAMRRHHKHYDHPAHYLRISVLFKKPFWQEHVDGSYFMSDAFGGCCIYDESARSAGATMGILGWLVGGEAALAMNNLDDDTLIRRAVDSLPACLQHGRDWVVEGRVHRWAGAVNGRPGGYPLIDPDQRHFLNYEQHPLVYVVGDYLFDSTLNGVVDSADCVAEWLTDELTEEPAVAEAVPATASPLVHERAVS